LLLTSLPKDCLQYVFVPYFYIMKCFKLIFGSSKQHGICYVAENCWKAPSDLIYM